MKLAPLALIVLASVVAVEVRMNASLERLEQAQNKAEIQFQQIRADW